MYARFSFIMRGGYAHVQNAAKKGTEINGFCVLRIARQSPKEKYKLFIGSINGDYRSVSYKIIEGLCKR